jgi:hypothetical protein
MSWYPIFCVRHFMSYQAARTTTTRPLGQKPSIRRKHGNEWFIGRIDPGDSPGRQKHRSLDDDAGYHPKTHRCRSSGSLSKESATSSGELEAVDNYVISRNAGRALEWQRTGWLWGAHKVDSLMTGSEAVAFSLLARFARNKLPEAISNDIAPFFAAAELRLAQQRPDNRNFRTWIDKIDSVDGTFTLLRPKPNPDVMRAVSTATFFERELIVTYRVAYKGDKTDAPPKRLCPLAIVESAGVMYMVAQDPTRPPRPEAGKPHWLRTLFRLDRISKAVDSGQSFDYPDISS